MIDVNVPHTYLPKDTRRWSLLDGDIRGLKRVIPTLDVSDPDSRVNRSFSLTVSRRHL
jgi:hypothetical protein